MAWHAGLFIYYFEEEEKMKLTQNGSDTFCMRRGWHVL